MKKIIFLIFTILTLSVSLSADISQWAAPSYNFTRINTQQLNQYDFHSVGAAYTILTDEDFGFYGSAGLFLPVSYVSNGQKGNVFDYYNSPLNFNTVLGIGSTISVEPGGEFTAGLGIHLQGIFLNHTQNDRYYFDSLTLGFASDFKYDFELNEKLRLGAGFQMGFNFIDLLHRGPDRLLNGITLNSSIVLGF